MATISGLHKTTAVDYPGTIACTIFISDCNFRCGFCHNPDIVEGKAEEIAEEEIHAFLDKRKGLLDGVCLTGGEPLLYPKLKELILKIKDKGFKVKLDTNGYMPEKLKELIDIVDFIAMDIKSDKGHYSKAAGIKVEIKRIEESIEIIKNSGKDYEFRSTIVPDFFDEEIIKNIAEWLKGSKKYSLQQFYSKGPLLDKGFEGKKSYSEKELNEFKEILKNSIEDIEVRV